MYRTSGTRIESKRVLGVLLFMALLIPVGTVFGLGRHRCDDQCIQCPQCHGCCTLEVSEEKESKTYWEVESEEICIPRFVFPWQNRKSRSCGDCGQSGCCGGCGDVCTHSCTQFSTDDCVTFECPSCPSQEEPTCLQPEGSCGPVNHNGARIRTVCRLRKKSHTCPKCKYTWSVPEVETTGCSAED